MSNEQLSDNAIRSAQTFFSELFREVSGGPIGDDLETARLTLEVNRHLSQLAMGGIEQSDGSSEAIYEFLSGVAFISVDRGELDVKPEDNVPQVCRIRYKEDGFVMNGSEDLIKWLVNFEVAGDSYTQIYSTITGQVGHCEAGIFEPVPEYPRGLVVIGNNLSMPFNNRTFVYRTN